MIMYPCLRTCRFFTRWLLLTLALASVAGLVDLFWPRMPRWVVHAARVEFHCFSPDSRFVLTTRGTDQQRAVSLQVWDARSGVELREFFKSAWQVEAFAFLPSLKNTLIVAVQPREYASWELHLVDLTTLASRKLDYPMQAWPWHTVSVAPKANRIAIMEASEEWDDSRLCLFDIDSETVLQEWRRLYFSQILLTDEILYFDYRLSDTFRGVVWDIQHRRDVAVIDEFNVGWSVDDDRILITQENLKSSRSRVKRWDLRAGTMLSDSVIENDYLSIASNGRWALAILNHPPPQNTPRSTVLWDLHRGRSAGKIPPGEYHLFEGVTHEGSDHLLTISTDGSVRLTDASTLAPVWEKRLTNPRETPAAFFWHDKKQRLLVRREGHTCYDWLDLATGRTLRSLEIAPLGYTQAWQDRRPEFSPDGRIVTTHVGLSREDSRLDRWLAPMRWLTRRAGPEQARDFMAVHDLETGRTLFRQAPDKQTDGLALSPDGTLALIPTEIADENDVVRRLECWDVPARTPWPWMVGFPIGLLASVGLGRRVWQRWRPKK